METDTDFELFDTIMNNLPDIINISSSNNNINVIQAISQNLNVIVNNNTIVSLNDILNTINEYSPEIGTNLGKVRNCIAKYLVTDQDLIIWTNNNPYFIHNSNPLGVLGHIFKGELHNGTYYNGAHYYCPLSNFTISNTHNIGSYGVYSADVIFPNGQIEQSKTFFPKNWSPQQVVTAIEETYNKSINNRIQCSSNPSNYESYYTFNNVTICLITDTNYNIVSAYPDKIQY